MANDVLAEIQASYEDATWDVEIKRRWPAFIVTGRGTRMDMYLQADEGGILVSVPNFQRCGLVPGDCSGPDVAEYVDIDNPVDARTLAAAVRWLVAHGYAE